MVPQQIPEPHQSLLFRLVEVCRDSAERDTGLVYFVEEPGGGLVLLQNSPSEKRFNGRSIEHLRFLQSLGLIRLSDSPNQLPSFIVLQDTLDYYKYHHRPRAIRWLVRVWEKNRNPLAIFDS
jgi:hypothetical protein